LLRGHGLLTWYRKYETYTRYSTTCVSQAYRIALTHDLQSTSDVCRWSALRLFSPEKIVHVLYFSGDRSMSRRKDPKYRHHKARNLAVVRIEGKDHYLGRYGSEESKAEYHRLLADWRAGLLRVGRDGPSTVDDGRPREDAAITVLELANRYWEFARQYYVKDGRFTQSGVKTALRYLRQSFGHFRATDFGPKALKIVRDEMIADDLSRTYINDNVARIKRCFRWATEEELIAGDVYQALRAVSSLTAGRSLARETEPVRPVDAEAVAATLPYMSRIIGDMVQLQLLSACRPSEVCQMMPGEIDRTHDVWIYEPLHHKTEHHGRRRQILIGPKAQGILLSYLLRGPHECCFTSRRTGAGYTPNAYRVAIARACKKAKVSVWTPYRLRHTKATEVRSRFGLEAAQVFLGHGTADVTQIYAERDLSLAKRVARELG
jgi:integrase